MKKKILEKNYEIMENIYKDYEDLFKSLKNLKNISIKQINDLFGNIEKDKELKIMSNHFLKKEDNQFIQDSNYLIIRIINEKE